MFKDDNDELVCKALERRLGARVVRTIFMRKLTEEHGGQNLTLKNLGPYAGIIYPQHLVPGILHTGWQTMSAEWSAEQGYTIMEYLMCQEMRSGRLSIL